MRTRNYAGVGASTLPTFPSNEGNASPRPSRATTVFILTSIDPIQPQLPRIQHALCTLCARPNLADCSLRILRATQTTPSISVEHYCASRPSEWHRAPLRFHSKHMQSWSQPAGALEELPYEDLSMMTAKPRGQVRRPRATLSLFLPSSVSPTIGNDQTLIVQRRRRTKKKWPSRTMYRSSTRGKFRTWRPNSSNENRISSSK